MRDKFFHQQKISPDSHAAFISGVVLGIALSWPLLKRSKMRNSAPAQIRELQTGPALDSSKINAPQAPVIEGDHSRVSSNKELLETPSEVIWVFLTLVASVLLFYFFVSLWYRWLRPNPSFLSFFTGIAGLVGISSLLSLQTPWGARMAGHAVQKLGLEGGLQQSRKIFIGVAGAALALGVLLYAGSPVASDYFNQQGADALDAGRYSQAILFFRQAISLSDKNSQAHFHLGSSYEYFRDFEQAALEYRVALEIDDKFWPAYNNLGRLYLVAFKDPDTALIVLLNGQDLVSDELGLAVLQKNIGWAYLEKNLPTTALGVLNNAGEALQELSGQRMNVSVYLAETLRITALVYEELGQLEAAQQAWNDTLGYALAISGSAACTEPQDRWRDDDCASASSWEAEAREQIHRLKTK